MHQRGSSATNQNNSKIKVKKKKKRKKKKKKKKIYILSDNFPKYFLNIIPRLDQKKLITILILLLT